MNIEKAGFRGYLPFLLGALGGIIAVLIISAQKQDKTFDERQLTARGDAFKWGFIAALSYLGISEFTTMFMGEWIEASTNLAFGLAIPCIAFGVTCVVKGAYIGIKQNFKGVFIPNITIAMVNIATGLLTTSENGWKFITNGLLTIDVRLIIGFALFVITIVLLINNRISMKNEVDYEES